MKDKIVSFAIYLVLSFFDWLYNVQAWIKEKLN
jgi:hypothetical protein